MNRPAQLRAAKPLKVGAKAAQPEAPRPTGPAVAAILVRGTVGARREIRDTLQHLRLGKKHACAVLPDSDAVRGMCRQAANYLAWGEVAPETLAALAKARGAGPVFHLSPPRKGFGRRGIKVGVGAGGALGYWGPKINDLITRML